MSRVFGLALQTTGLSVPSFGDLGAEGSPDVRIEWSPQPRNARTLRTFQRPWYQSSSRGLHGRPRVVVHRLADGSFHFRYADLTEFAVAADGSLVRASWPETSTLEYTATYLGPILGFVLRLRGVTCLHASAAALGDAAIAFVGDAGAGKSTTIAALARNGLPVLTDDLLALAEEDDRFVVQPGLPRVLLWPETAEALWDAPDALPRIVPHWEKLYLNLKQPGYSYCDRPLPLAAIYVLGERDPRAARPTIEVVSGTDALIRLVANTYANYLLDNDMRAHELGVLGRLVNRVPVRLAKAPDDRSRISEFCDAVIEDFEEICR